jgi:hypothetical protein
MKFGEGKKERKRMDREERKGPEERQGRASDKVTRTRVAKNGNAAA